MNIIERMGGHIEAKRLRLPTGTKPITIKVARPAAIYANSKIMNQSIYSIEM